MQNPVIHHKSIKRDLFTRYALRQHEHHGIQKTAVLERFGIIAAKICPICEGGRDWIRNPDPISTQESQNDKHK